MNGFEIGTAPDCFRHELSRVNDDVLRELFAAVALAGFTSSLAIRDFIDDSAIARQAYDLADAMIKERKRRTK